MPVQLVPVEAVLDLRRQVLRPGRPRETALTDVDLLPDTFHVAVYTDSGELGACATFSSEPLPGDLPASGFPDGQVRRLRKMASAPHLRGQGFGGEALRAGMRESAVRGARLVWCSGRLAAAGFYRHHGFTAIGDRFTVPGIGEHFYFVRELA
ncbi:putative GNAT family N-acyltransferase [Streptacidiphilus sp. MAP12-33]|uniref:GNAT family N-acetyltransferase n=1 Tax=Streptacidiphilus sp. MAP12-33 TaxID=3156266 RepID=UPI0035138CC4